LLGVQRWEQVLYGDGLIAVWAWAAGADSGAWPVAVMAPLLGEVALLAVAALVDGGLLLSRAIGFCPGAVVKPAR